jgi:hypothetical protein
LLNGPFAHVANGVTFFDRKVAFDLKMELDKGPVPGVTRPQIMDALDARTSQLRIPTKPAMHSNLKPATYTDLKPATVPI